MRMIMGNDTEVHFAAIIQKYVSKMYTGYQKLKCDVKQTLEHVIIALIASYLVCSCVVL